jgi:hypothetical protein
MSPDALEERLRRLGDAVGDATVVSSRSIGDRDDIAPVVPLPPRSRVPVLTIAAVVAVLVAVAAAVAVGASRRDDHGAVTVGPAPSTSVGGIPPDLPRLAPSFLPSGTVLGTASVRSGSPTQSIWIRRYRALSADVVLELEIAPAATANAFLVPDQAGVTLTDFADGRRTEVQAGHAVDIGGRAATINPTTVTPGGGAPQAGFVVGWTDDAGDRIDLFTASLTEDEATAMARGVRITAAGEQPTADVDPSAVPAFFELEYAGIDYSAFANTAGSSGPPGISLTYRDTGTAKNPNPNVADNLAISLVETPVPAGGDPAAWLDFAGGDRVVHGTNGLDLLVRPAVDSEAVDLVGVGDGVIVQIDAYKQSEDDVIHMAESLHPLAPADWAAYLASATVAPYPPVVEQPADATLCDALRKPPGIDQFSTSSVAAMARADASAGSSTSVAGDLQTIATALDKLAGATPLGHDDIVHLRPAVTHVRAWMLGHCTANASGPPTIDTLLLFAPNLVDQDPALNDFCQQFAALDPLATTITDYTTRAARLDEALATIPPGDGDLRAAVTELRDRWREVPDGRRPDNRPNDPIVTDPPVIGHSCPDWPLH